MLTYNSESLGQDELFVSFDRMVDEDPQLWKVETIGDAFMVAAGLNIDSAASVRSMGISTSESDLMISNCENYSKLSVSTFGGGGRPSQKAKEAGEEKAPHLESDCITCAQVRNTKLRHLTITNSSLPSINTMIFCT